MVGALDCLWELGVAISDTGRPCRTNALSGRPLGVSEVGLLDCPPKQAEIQALLDAIRVEKLEALEDTRGKACLMHASHELAGAWLTASARDMLKEVSDEQMLIALRWRLGMDTQCAASPCQHRYSSGDKEGQVCGAECDAKGDHACRCTVGPSMNALHDGLCDVVADFARSAGYAALREQTVPEFGTKSRWRGAVAVQGEARLDTDLLGLWQAAPYLLDITVRHPCSKSALKASSSVHEKTLRDKELAYPATGSKRVTCCSIDTFGGAGRNMMGMLALFAKLAGQRQQHRGLHPSRWYQRWRAKLSWHIALGNARSIELAGACIGQRSCADPEGRLAAQSAEAVHGWQGLAGQRSSIVLGMSQADAARNAFPAAVPGPQSECESQGILGADMLHEAMSRARAQGESCGDTPAAVPSAGLTGGSAAAGQEAVLPARSR